MASLISLISPEWALRRAQARRALAYYEAARKDLTRKQRRATGSGSREVKAAGSSIYEQARHLEQNHDLARAVLRVLVNNSIGSTGITVEPTPLNKRGEIHADFARQLLDVFDEWGERPEVTRQYTWPKVQRLLQRSAIRDGEVFQRFIAGVGASLTHASRVPLSIELLERDFVPPDFDGEKRYDINGAKWTNRIRESVELSAWGQPIAYWATKEHPRDTDSILSLTPDRQLLAADTLHHAFRDRLHQRRGMSEFAAILGRLDDIKDYETSEAVAAKVAASLGAAITKGTPDMYADQIGEGGEVIPRDLKFRAGMIFDDLEPGESVQMLGSNGRPNPGLVPFRNGLMNAACAGVGASASSVTRVYDGSYSARRQELVDSWVDYGVLSQDFAATIVRPTYRRVISTAIAAGVIKIPADVDRNSILQAAYMTPQMPWIDPLKEQQAWGGLESNGHASGPEIIRKRGRSPSDVLREEAAWRKQLTDVGITPAFDPQQQQQQTGPAAGRQAA